MTAFSITGTVLFLGLALVAAFYPVDAFWLRYCLPLLPLAVMVVIGLRDPGQFPAWFIFVVGIFVDLFSHGPIGFWAFVYLFAQFFVLLLPLHVLQRRVQRVFAIGGVMTVLMCTMYLIVSLYQLGWTPFQPVFLACAVVAILIVGFDWVLPDRTMQGFSFTHEPARHRSGGGNVSTR